MLYFVVIKSFFVCAFLKTFHVFGSFSHFFFLTKTVGSSWCLEILFVRGNKQQGSGAKRMTSIFESSVSGCGNPKLRHAFFSDFTPVYTPDLNTDPGAPRLSGLSKRQLCIR